MNPTEVAMRFLEHYRHRGTTFLPGPESGAGPVHVRHPSGPDIPITQEQFRGRVQGFLGDSGIPAAPEQVTAITLAALDQIAHMATGEGDGGVS